MKLSLINQLIASSRQQWLFRFGKRFVIFRGKKMRSLSRVEVGVSGACGFVVVAFMVAICCLLWWGIRRAISRGLLEVCRSPGRDILLRVLFSGKKNKSRASSTPTDVVVDPCCQLCSSVIITLDHEESTTSGEEGEDDDDENSVEAPVEDENRWGPPWLLFTIREETEEEMKAAMAEEEEESSSSTAGRGIPTTLTLADFLNQGCPESVPLPSPPPSPRKLIKSLKFAWKKFSVPFHPPPVVVAAPEINDSCHSSSSSADAIDGPLVTIVIHE